MVIEEGKHQQIYYYYVLKVRPPLYSKKFANYTILAEASLTGWMRQMYLQYPEKYCSSSIGILSQTQQSKAWATANNPSLNATKSCEMIVRRPRMAVYDPAIPPVHPGL